MIIYKIVKEDHPVALEQALNFYAEEGFRAVSFSTINHPGANSVWFMVIMEREIINTKRPDPPPTAPVSYKS